jgi:hypothetical protein
VKLLLRWATLLMVGGVAVPLQAQAPVLELDHFYLLVPPGGVAEAQALRNAGLVVDTTVLRHDGEGTASMAAFFENAYLELFWVDSVVAVDSAHRKDVEDFQRGTAWQRTGASPFGIGLHVLSGSTADLRVPVRIDSTTDVTYVLLRQPAESLAAALFVMPGDRAVPSWIARSRNRKPNLFAHPMGGRRITGIVIHGPAEQRPSAADLDLRLIRFQPDSRTYAVIEFDGGREGETRDLRPALPLVLRR